MLKRAFITLYLAVVLAVAVAGWGLDRLYQSLQAEPGVSATERALVTLAREQFKQGQTPALPDGVMLSVFGFDELAESALKERIISGELVSLDGREQRQIYALLAHSDRIVRLVLPVPTRGGLLSDSLLLVFYLVLAVAVYLWIWPLVRDLRSLAQQAQAVGRRQSRAVQLGSSSAVYPVAVEFNRMRQRIDELLASYREMTYAVSHELRTPLARMKFALELADPQRAEPAQVAAQWQSLRADVREMDDLVNQLLQYAGFESHSQALDCQPGDMGALVHQIAGRVESVSAGVSFELDDQLAGRPVWCEWHLMERVMHNLLTNAAKYASHNVGVKLQWQGDECEIVVEDDGPGIGEADRERVFESFVRLHQNPERDTQGFGLGLAIVRRIVHWHGGQAAAGAGRSLPGARFEVRWPADKASHSLSI